MNYVDLEMDVGQKILSEGRSIIFDNAAYSFDQFVELDLKKQPTYLGHKFIHFFEAVFYCSFMDNVKTGLQLLF